MTQHRAWAQVAPENRGERRGLRIPRYEARARGCSKAAAVRKEGELHKRWYARPLMSEVIDSMGTSGPILAKENRESAITGAYKTQGELLDVFFIVAFASSQRSKKLAWHQVEIRNRHLVLIRCERDRVPIPIGRSRRILRGRRLCLLGACCRT